MLGAEACPREGVPVMAGADGSLEGYRVPAGVEEPGAPKGSAAGVHAPARPVVVDGYVR